MRRAKDKQAALDQVIEEMNEAARQKDTARIEELNDEGYEFARGSNSRKDELQRAYHAAIAACEQ